MRHRSRCLPKNRIARKKIRDEGDELMEISENQPLAESGRAVEFVLDFPFPFTYYVGACAEGLMREAGVV